MCDIPLFASNTRSIDVRLVAAAGGGLIAILRETWLPVMLAVLGLCSGFVSVFYAVPLFQMRGSMARVSSLEEIRRSPARVFVIVNLTARLDLSGSAPVYAETEDSSCLQGNVVAAPLVDRSWTKNQPAEVWAGYRDILSCPRFLDNGKC